MIHFQRRWTAVVLFGALLVLGAFGCGGDDDDDSGGGSADDDADDDISDDDTDDDAGDDDTDDDADDDVDDDTDDDTGDDDTSGTTTTTTVTTTTSTTTTTWGVEIDFDDYTTGSLGSPWSVNTSGSSTASIVPVVAADGSGKELYIDGGTLAGDILTAFYTFGSVDFDLSISFDFWYSSGSSSRVDITQPGGTIEILTRIGYDDKVVANGSECTLLTANTWIKFTYLIDFDAATYDILLDDFFTPCVDIPFQVGAGDPLAKFAILDETNAGLGGDAYYDNIVITEN